MRLALAALAIALLVGCRPRGPDRAREPGARTSNRPAASETIEGPELPMALLRARTDHCGRQDAALRVDAGLASMAIDAATDLAGALRISHRIGFTSADDRARANGVRRFVGEVLASGRLDVADAVGGWLGSPSHRRILCSRGAIHVGTAVRDSTRRHGVRVYVAEFAISASEDPR